MSWLKHFSKNSSSRMTLLVVLLLTVAILTPFMSYLGTVFGWTNPDQAPPGGSGLLTRSGTNLGINTANPSTTLTVSGMLSVSGNRIRDVATPVAGGDGVNKDYVDAQVFGGGGGLGAGVTTLTLYGVSSASPTAGQEIRMGGAIPACLRGYAGNGGCAGAITQPAGINAGDGTPACTSLGSGWTQVFAGWGPLNIMHTWYGASQNPGSADEDTAPVEAAALSDSICSSAVFAYVRDISTGAGVVQNSQSFVGACTLTDCNTCRICLYTYTTSTP